MNANKKFVAIKTLQNIEVKTDIGYVPVKNIMKTIEYDLYEVEFSNGKILKCADNHILIDTDDYEVFAINSIDRIIKTDNGSSRVISVNPINTKNNMYDIQMQYHHKYYTDGILSHNTTFAAAYIVHQVVFNPEYTTAVLANKGATSREILSRIKLMYEELPWFLQMGVSEWNKGSIELGNKSKVISAAASTSSIRGKTVNCVDINTNITVKNKITGEIENITIAELEKRIGISQKVT